MCKFYIKLYLNYILKYMLIIYKKLCKFYIKLDLDISNFFKLLSELLEYL